MNIPLFHLEQWFQEYTARCRFNLGSSNCASISLTVLRELTGERIDLDEILLSAGPDDGLEELREAIAQWYTGVGPEDVHITCSSSEAIYVLARTQLRAGDEFVGMSPMYPSLHLVAEFVGARFVPWRLKFEHGFAPDLDELESLVTSRTRAIVLNNPNNPTGLTLGIPELRRVIEIADRVGAEVWCDEVFRGITVDGHPPTTSLRDLSEKAAVIGSMSKVFGMGGLRIGWVVAPGASLDGIRRYRHLTTLGTSVMDQKVATVVLRHRAAILARNQAIVDANFSSLKIWMASRGDRFTWTKPTGGTITFPKFARPTNTEEFCRFLAERFSVIVVPGGYAFGEERHLRIGFGECREFEEGLERFSRALEEFRTS